VLLATTDWISVVMRIMTWIQEFLKRNFYIRPMWNCTQCVF